MYAYAMSYLPKNGFAHYEVSNFAAKGYRCVHNINYWDNNEYIGIGPSAASCIDGVRKRCIPDVEEYMKRSHRGGTVFVSPEKRWPGHARQRETAASRYQDRRRDRFAWSRRRRDIDLVKLEAGVINGWKRRRAHKNRKVGGSKTGHTAY
jgi:hypothetical protein